MSARKDVRQWLLVLALAAAKASAGESEPPDAAPSFALTRVRVFDGRTVLDNATVVVRNGRIESLGRDRDVPPGLALIDGTGKTLLPGLINSHAHSASVLQLREEAVFGVTTVLNMYADPAAVAATRRAGASRQAGVMADLLSSGNMVIAPGSGAHRELSAPAISGPAAAAEFVDARLREGSDYIKIIYGNAGSGDPVISRDTLGAVTAAAHHRRKLVVAHIDSPSGALDAVNAGVDGLAHLYLGGQPADTALVAAARNKRAFVIPTLTVLETLAGIRGAAGLLAHPAIAPYLSEKAIANLNAPSRPNPALKLSYTQQLVSELNRAGVPILAGTDEPMPGTWNGVSLHRELELLWQSGMSPLQVLASATSIPAQHFRMTDRGRIAPGLRADLVLVDGDPTVGILATRNIARVWKDGREVDREAFAKEIQAAKNRPSIELPVTVLRTYAGRYDFGRQMVFGASVKDGQLHLDLPNGKSFPLQASSPVDFFSKEIGLELRFEKDAAGAVTSAVIKQGDEERRGKKVE